MMTARPIQAKPAGDARLVVHLIEPGGNGGVFQHTAALAEALSGEGAKAVLHTASDAEATPAGVELCPCVDWHRNRASGPLRSVAIVASYVLRTLPHIRMASRTADVVHVQGLFRQPLTLLTLAVGRHRQRVLAFSPHNTFSRAGRRWEERLLRRCARLADVVFVFSDADLHHATQWTASVVKTQLIQIVGKPDCEQVRHWRERWRTGQSPDAKIVLLAGQLRRDKGGDLLVRALSKMGADIVGAFVGEDKGAADAWQQLAEQLGVRAHWSISYQTLDSFVAALAAADVVVAPSTAASQSAVLSIAASLGATTVAADVGGLGELATITVAPGNATSLADGIAEALEAASHRTSSAPYGSRAAGDHLFAYRDSQRNHRKVDTSLRFARTESDRT